MPRIHADWSATTVLPVCGCRYHGPVFFFFFESEFVFRGAYYNPVRLFMFVIPILRIAFAITEPFLPNNCEQIILFPVLTASCLSFPSLYVSLFLRTLGNDDRLLVAAARHQPVRLLYIPQHISLHSC